MHSLFGFPGQHGACWAGFVCSSLSKHLPVTRSWQVAGATLSPPEGLRGPGESPRSCTQPAGAAALLRVFPGGWSRAQRGAGAVQTNPWTGAALPGTHTEHQIKCLLDSGPRCPCWAQQQGCAKGTALVESISWSALHHSDSLTLQSAPSHLYRHLPGVPVTLSCSSSG